MKSKQWVMQYLKDNPGKSIGDMSMDSGFSIEKMTHTVLSLLGRGDIMTDGMKEDPLLRDKVHLFRLPNDNGKHF
jgi:hypothetical protein